MDTKATAEQIDIKVQISYNVTASSGAGASKRTKTYSSIVMTATDDQLYSFGKAIETLMNNTVNEIRKVEVSKLNASAANE